MFISCDRWVLTKRALVSPTPEKMDVAEGGKPAAPLTEVTLRGSHWWDFTRRMPGGRGGPLAARCIRARSLAASYELPLKPSFTCFPSIPFSLLRHILLFPSVISPANAKLSRDARSLQRAALGLVCSGASPRQPSDHVERLDNAATFETEIVL